MSAKTLPSGYRLSEEDQKKLDEMNKTFENVKEKLGETHSRAIAKTFIESDDYVQIRDKEKANRKRFQEDNQVYYQDLQNINEMSMELDQKQDELKKMEDEFKKFKNSFDQATNQLESDKQSLQRKKALIEGKDIPESVERKAKAIQFLIKKNMDTPENRAMIDAVKYTVDAIEIGGVRRSYDMVKENDIDRNEVYKQFGSNIEGFGPLYVIEGGECFVNMKLRNHLSPNQLKALKLNYNNEESMSLQALPRGGLFDILLGSKSKRLDIGNDYFQNLYKPA